jgi:hypothetical protein
VRTKSPNRLDVCARLQERRQGALSTYLGFIPGRTLHEYAEFLPTSQEAAKAAEVDALEEHGNAQFSNFLRQQSQMRNPP